MTWTVIETGAGSAKYDSVRVIDGGALECTKNIPQGHWVEAKPTVVAFYGPGMWVSATEDRA